MPRLFPSTPMRLARLKVGATLVQMSKHTGYSLYTLSMVERQLLRRPEVLAAMKRFLSAQAAS